MSSVFRIAADGVWPLNVLRYCSTSNAEMPVMTGLDIDVPESDAYGGRSGTVEIWLTPLATTSGLMRPSRAGPRELKLAMKPLLLTAPTEITFLRLASRPTVPYGP